MEGRGAIGGALSALGPVGMLTGRLLGEVLNDMACLGPEGTAPGDASLGAYGAATGLTNDGDRFERSPACGPVGGARTRGANPRGGELAAGCRAGFCSIVLLSGPGGFGTECIDEEGVGLCGPSIRGCSVIDILESWLGISGWGRSICLSAFGPVGGSAASPEGIAAFGAVGIVGVIEGAGVGWEGATGAIGGTGFAT